MADVKVSAAGILVEGKFDYFYPWAAISKVVDGLIYLNKGEPVSEVGVKDAIREYVERS